MPKHTERKRRRCAHKYTKPTQLTLLENRLQPTPPLTGQDGPVAHCALLCVPRGVSLDFALAHLGVTSETCSRPLPSPSSSSVSRSIMWCLHLKRIKRRITGEPAGLLTFFFFSVFLDDITQPKE